MVASYASIFAPRSNSLEAQPSGGVGDDYDDSCSALDEALSYLQGFAKTAAATSMRWGFVFYLELDHARVAV